MVDAESGETLGRHDGAYAFTVGQRRGLALGRPAADGARRYVVGVDLPSSTVLVGPPVLLEVDRVEAERPRWCGPAPTGPLEGIVQLRAHGEPVDAVVEQVEGDDGATRLVASLRTRVRGVAPGQALVVYDGDRVVGSATITRASRA